MDSLSIIYHDSVRCLILANVMWYAFANFVISEVYDDLLIMYTALFVHQSHWPVYCRSLSQEPVHEPVEPKSNDIPLVD